MPRDCALLRRDREAVRRARDECYKITEPKMDKAILDAALDTKLITREEWRLKKEEIE